MIAEKLDIHGASGYKVIIGSFALSDTLKTFTEKYSSAYVISDSNVLPLWRSYVGNNIACPAYFFSAGAGEEIKDLGHLSSVWSFLARNGADRKSLLIALGGGTVGDLAGFAAATYMRGISFLQIPTTLLAMTDSSVGGKNGIDLPEAKNAVGTFRRPELVICDTEFLSTLPVQEYKNGMAEVIKYAFIDGKGLIELLDSDKPDTAKIISSCLKIKKRLIEEDEFDTGVRRYLNFGHTVGHAVEKLSGFTLPHGLCVAYGCETVLRASAAGGLCKPELTDKFINYTIKYSERVNPGFSADDILHQMLSDKKTVNGRLNFVIVRDIGRPGILTLEADKALSFVKAGLGK